MTRYIRAAGAQLTFLYSNTGLYRMLFGLLEWQLLLTGYFKEVHTFHMPILKLFMQNVWGRHWRAFADCHCVYLFNKVNCCVVCLCLCKRLREISSLNEQKYKLYVSTICGIGLTELLLTVQPIMRRVVPSAIYIIPGNFTILPRCQEKAHIYPHSSSGLCFKINNL